LKLNNSTTFTSLSVIMLLVISLILLQACGIHSQRSGQSESGKQGRVITVTSNPTGATIRADGSILGETPLDLAKSFSRGWVRGEEYGVVYRINGALTIEKNGCSVYSVPVSETAPSEDISITLVCTEKEQATSSGEPVKSTTSEIPDNMEQRLKKLEKLYPGWRYYYG